MANSDRESLEQIWSLLDSETERHEQRIPFQELQSSTGDGRTLAALDHLGRRMLLLPVSPRLRCREEKGGRGISTGLRKWSLNGKLQWYYFLRCEDERLKSVFCRVAEAVSERLDNGRDACRAVDEVLSEFRDLLKRPRAPLTREEQLGLIAELMTLRSLLLYDPHSIYCWVGPRGSRHDFTAPGVHLEVKAAMQQSASSLRVHGIHQLNVEGTESLYLLYYTFDETPGMDLTISNLMEECRQATADVDTFDRLIEAVGITDRNAEDTDLSVSLAGRRLYVVDSGFPKVVPDSFTVGRLPNGIIAMDYTIDLSTASNSELPDERLQSVLRNMAKHGTEAT